MRKKNRKLHLRTEKVSTFVVRLRKAFSLLLTIRGPRIKIMVNRILETQNTEAEGSVESFVYFLGRLPITNPFSLLVDFSWEKSGGVSGVNNNSSNCTLIEIKLN